MRLDLLLRTEKNLTKTRVKGRLFQLLFVCFFSVFCLAIVPVVSATAAERVALVIGNSHYKNVPLKNPVNDATDISASLRRLHFDVQLATDADKRQMLRQINIFANKLKRAEIGFFFYAGHGMQIKGANYLIPVGTEVVSSADVEFEAVHAGRILAKMEEAGNSLNMVVLDACRNNPYRGTFRSTGQGLARMDAPVGSIIAYATSPGSVAHDGKGRNGVFTKYLLQSLERPDLTVRDIFDRAGLGVMRETKRGQVPWVHSSPMEPIYLAGGNPDDIVSDAGKGYRAESATGTLRVTSDPTGAAVALGGESAGTTPLQLGNIPVGTMQVAVSKSGYVGEQQPVMVKAGHRAVVSFVLEEEKTTGWLTVRANPGDAKVRILNIVPPYRTGMELSAGRYHLEVSAAGYISARKWVDLAAGDDLTVDISLLAKKPVPITSKQQNRVHSSSSRSFTDSKTGMEFVFVKGGCYQMGDTFGDGARDEKPVHEVCLDDFYMGKYEVTQAEYKKIMGSNPSKSKKGDRYPVEQVSWEDAQEFIQKLNRRTGKSFRLPTEAEWEYAARSGGRKEKYSGGNSIESVAWYYGNSGGSTHRVGQKQANGLGLHDMSGNVWEWCQDRYGKDYYSKSPRKNPKGPGSGSHRVYRGGSWLSIPSLVRAAYRYRDLPWLRIANVGFRLAFSSGQ